MSTKITITQSLLTITLAFSLSTSIYAANLCKGAKEKACYQSDSCTWIKAYKRKDGANIKAYCRAKPSKKSKLTQSKNTKTSTATKPSAKKKAASKIDASKKKLMKETKKTSETTSN